MTDLYYAGYADALRYALRVLDRDGTPSPEVRRFIREEIASAERCARHGDLCVCVLHSHTYRDTPIPAREGSE